MEQPGVYLEDLCFDAQQAAEKAIKALLLHRGIPFPYVHDLVRLLDLLQQSGINIPERVREAVWLSDYAVEARYPGPAEPVTREEYQKALALAANVVRWVESLLQENQSAGDQADPTD